MVIMTAVALGTAAYSIWKGYNQYKAYQRMQSDFHRNTGRTIRYASVRGYDWRSYDAISNAAYGAGSMYRTVRDVSRLYR